MRHLIFWGGGGNYELHANPRGEKKKKEDLRHLKKGPVPPLRKGEDSGLFCGGGSSGVLWVYRQHGRAGVGKLWGKRMAGLRNRGGGKGVHYLTEKSDAVETV